MHGADRVAVPPFAIHLGATVFIHGVIAGQQQRTVRDQTFDDLAHQESSQLPARPASLGEDAAIAGGVAGDKRSQGRQEVGNDMSSDGEQSGDQEQGKAEGSGGGEGVCQGIAHGACRSGELAVELAELSADGACLASLSASSLVSLAFGKAMLPLFLGYTGHSRLLGRDTGSVKSPSFLQGGWLFGQLTR